MDPCFLNVLHDPTDDYIGPIRNCININLGCLLQKIINQNRMLWRGLYCVLHVMFQSTLIVYDFHGASSKNIRGAHYHGISDLRGDLLCLFKGRGGSVRRLLEAQGFQNFLETLSIFRSVDVIRAGSNDRNACLH